MAEQANPLDQLKDIHLPQQVDQLQLAPGWWLVIGLFLFATFWLISKWIKKRQALALLSPANKELETIARMTPDNQAIAQLSALLKRICLIYYPQHQVASLAGNNWVKFLNQQAGEDLLTGEHLDIFTRLAYQPNQNIPSADWQKLIDNCRVIIDKIIRKSAKRALREAKR